MPAPLLSARRRRVRLDLVVDLLGLGRGARHSFAAGHRQDVIRCRGSAAELPVNLGERIAHGWLRFGQREEHDAPGQAPDPRGIVLHEVTLAWLPENLQHPVEIGGADQDLAFGVQMIDTAVIAGRLDSRGGGRRNRGRR